MRVEAAFNGDIGSRDGKQTSRWLTNSTNTKENRHENRT
jgi:hypothetical protein